MGHEYYLSLCDIEYNSETSSLEITLKVFTDDLEEALYKQGTGRLYLGTNGEADDADEHVFNYIRSNVEIWVNEKEVTIENLGKEVDHDLTWCYVEVSGIKTINRVTVANTILMELFETQVNMVHVKVNNERKSLLLRHGTIKDTVEFN
ncbi:MAG: DUF6702 family protein [Calditrichota bacterium]